MSDLTTEGYEATAAEIEGMVRNLCAYALSEPDPTQRYIELTHQQVLFEGMVESIRRERGRVLADLVVDGVPEAELAETTKLGTVLKVRKLISAAGQTQRVQEAAAARKAAEREAALASKAAAKANPNRDANGSANGYANGHANGHANGSTEPELPPHLAAPTGRRLLTQADLEALGLAVKSTPVEGKPRKRQRKAAQKAGQKA